jgi:hypothetical protein
MKNDYKDSKFRKWLDQLQQESWELELLISGFAIFGLFMVYKPLSLSIKVANNEGHTFQLIISIIAIIASSILIFNLLLHIILRGIWIGALGLRYVSGDIDYEELNYSEKFTSYLKNKIGSFDKYIAILENYCSVLFAVSFLLIFYMLSVVLSFLYVAAIAQFLIDNESYGGVFNIIGIILLFVFLLGILLTLVDFIGQGILKKNKRISKFYFPVYWLFSYLTLSFLYRPLVYNFLDNKFGKRLTFMLVPAYIAIMILTSVKYQNSNYLEIEKSSSSYYADSRNYDDMLSNDDDFVKIASIPSKVILDPYLKVFIDYTAKVEDQIFSYNEKIKPKTDRRGLNISYIFTDNPYSNSKVRDSLTRAYLNTFNEMYIVVIDSMDYDTNFLITTNNKKYLGFETFLNIKDLSEGKHQLKIKRRKIKNKDTLILTRISIPFWHFKD